MLRWQLFLSIDAQKDMVCDLLLYWIEMFENGLLCVKVGIKLKIELSEELCASELTFGSNADKTQIF